MATYAPESLGIKAPAEGFQEGGWYSGRQYWGGTLSDPNTIHPLSNQQGAGQAVSAEVRAQSAAKQGVSSQQFDSYLKQQGASPQYMPGYGAVSGAQPQGVSAPSAFKSPFEGMSDDEIFSKYYNTPEAKGLREELAGIEKARDETIGEYRNNPWYTEATMVGKLDEVQAKYNRDINRVNNQLARIQADSQIKYGIANDIYTRDRQAYQDQLSMFSTLLNAGAFSSASGQDLAQWSAATGIPTSMMDSIVKTQQSKNLSLQTFDDGKNSYVVAIDPDGNIVNRTLLGTKVSSGSAKQPTEFERQQYYTDKVRELAGRGATLDQIFSTMAGTLDPNLIYQIYNSSSMYGPDKSSASDLERWFGVNLKQQSEFEY